MKNETVQEAIRRAAAERGWPNWYINRGRMSHNPTLKELRAVSNRRIF